MVLSGPVVQNRAIISMRSFGPLQTEFRYEAAQVHLMALPYLTGVAYLATKTLCTGRSATGIAELGDGVLLRVVNTLAYSV
jgi:hypothetical protein